MPRPRPRPRAPVISPDVPLTPGQLDALNFLLHPRIYPGALAPMHAADLAKSGLSAETIARQRICSVPPGLIDKLLGFSTVRRTPKAISAYLLPFARPVLRWPFATPPRARWMPHVRLRMFYAASLSDAKPGAKYLGPKHIGPRLYFPLVTLHAVLTSPAPLYLVEGAKKSLAVAQLGLPAIGLEGVEGWHERGATTLHPDFFVIPLRGRQVDLLPDGDVQSNPHVARAVTALTDALETCGAHVRLVCLPSVLPSASPAPPAILEGALA